MRQFTGKPGRLRVMALEVRAVYSIFLAFTLAGTAMTLWLAHEMVGFELSRVEEYYAGAPSKVQGAARSATAEPAAAGPVSAESVLPGSAPVGPALAVGGLGSEATASAPAGAGGPALDLPPELDRPLEDGPMARRKLLEVTHFHLFSMPVYLVILAHLYALSSAGSRAKLGWIGVATLATAVHIAAPWAVAKGTGTAALWYGASGFGLLAAYLVMCLVPLWEMWAPAPQPARVPA